MDTKKLAQLLQGRTLPKPSSGNQRAYADQIEELACELARTEYPVQYQKARSVRSPEDFTIVDAGQTMYVDVKTRQLGTDFNMPNLISVDRLDKLLTTASTELYYWMIDYRVQEDGTCVIEHSELRTVWSLPWSALAIQNLGKGQLQIAKWSEMHNYATDRAKWHEHLRGERRRFYLKQASKFQRMADAIK
jgi:hypothetical protein